MRRGWLEETAVHETRAATPATTPGLCGFLDRCPARIEGVCDRLPPPSVRLAGSEVLCHRGEAGPSPAP
jgi:peptide/nickel transport system ATP-binding protein